MGLFRSAASVVLVGVAAGYTASEGGITAASPIQSAAAGERVEIQPPRGPLVGTLTPGQAPRSPIVLVVSRAASLDSSAVTNVLGALHRAGIGTLTYPLRESSIVDTAHDAALFLAALRNDVRSGSIVVLGVEDGMSVATVAARTGRADGLALLAPKAGTGESLQELDRFTRSKVVLGAEPAQQLQAFLRSIDAPGAERPRRPAGERRSLRDVMLADVDGVRVSVEYGRPSKRGREIWGALVPFGRWWTPGADEGTTFTVSGPVHLGDLAIPAGDYSLYTIPRAEGFELIVNKETGQFHTVYNDEHDLGRVTLVRTASPEPLERLTFVVDRDTAGGASFGLGWDDRIYRAPLRVTR
jgi:hypothetical protein